MNLMEQSGIALKASFATIHHRVIFINKIEDFSE
jgi:hypothetical protein